MQRSLSKQRLRDRGGLGPLVQRRLSLLCEAQLRTDAGPRRTVWSPRSGPGGDISSAVLRRPLRRARRQSTELPRRSRHCARQGRLRDGVVEHSEARPGGGRLDSPGDPSRRRVASVGATLSDVARRRAARHVLRLRRGVRARLHERRSAPPGRLRVRRRVLAVPSLVRDDARLALGPQRHVQRPHLLV